LLGLIGLAIGAPPLVRWLRNSITVMSLWFCEESRILDEEMPDRLVTDDQFE
jgi:hypothetical protein